MPQNKPTGNIESNGSIWMEAVKPQAPPVIQDKAIPAPDRQGNIHQDMISPEPKAGPGWRNQVKPAPATQDDIKRPGYSDLIKS